MSDTRHDTAETELKRLRTELKDLLFQCDTSYKEASLLRSQSTTLRRQCTFDERASVYRWICHELQRLLKGGDADGHNRSAGDMDPGGRASEEKHAETYVRGMKGES